MRKDYYKRLDERVTVKLLPGAPADPWGRAEAVIEMRTFREMDEGNAHTRTKWVFDWLQSRRYIVNDKDLAYTLNTRTGPRKNMGITLTLREVA